MSSLLDLSGVSDQSESSPIPSGVYTVRVLEAKLENYEKDGESRSRLDLQMEVVAPATFIDPKTKEEIALAGRKFRDTWWVSPKALPRFKANLAKFGLTDSKFDTELLGGQLSGRAATAYLQAKVTTLQDGTTGMPAVNPETGKPITTNQVNVREYFGRAPKFDIAV
mgnify:CR=1 FL=1